MNASLNKKTRDKITDSVINTLDITTLSNSKSMNWINEFRGLNSDDKKIIIREIIKQQTTSVIKGMHSKDDNIELLGLGRFIIKPMRKTYYDIRRDNPNLSNNEVVDLVKKKYLERKNNAKILLNKDNLKTT